MGEIGKTERVTQTRVIKLFKNELGYTYLGNWEEQLRTSPIENGLLKDFLVNTQGYSVELAQKAVERLVRASEKISNGLYGANKETYKLLRYGVTVRESQGQPKETVKLIDWGNPENNHFGIAEEVSFAGKHIKRPDLVIYVNGIALAVIELKRSKVGVSEGIRQNLDNQSDEFIPKFFTNMQFVLAGNDTQGLRYGTIETSEKYYLQWKEDADKAFPYILDKHLYLMFNKPRFLELIHDFVIFDKGIKKTLPAQSVFWH